MLRTQCAGRSLCGLTRRVIKHHITHTPPQADRERVRILYERLLDRTKHVKVWLSYARFEGDALPLPEPEDGDEEGEAAAAARAAEEAPDAAALRSTRARQVRRWRGSPLARAAPLIPTPALPHCHPTRSRPLPKPNNTLATTLTPLPRPRPRCTSARSAACARASPTPRRRRSCCWRRGASSSADAPASGAPRARGRRSPAAAQCPVSYSLSRALPLRPRVQRPRTLPPAARPPEEVAASVEVVEKKMPRRIKRKRPVAPGSEVHGEFYDYVFPDEVGCFQATCGGHLPSRAFTFTFEGRLCVG